MTPQPAPTLERGLGPLHLWGIAVGLVGTHSGWLHMLVWIGLFGLIASFHGTAQ